MKSIATILMLATAACSSSPTGDSASLRSIDFVVPSGWKRHDLSTQSRSIAEWMPTDNQRKESITVIAAERPPNAKLSAVEVRALLAKAQRSLPGAVFSQPTAFSTKQGLVGFRVDGSFVPAGQTEPYRRIHAAVLDGTSIVHVLYTAKDAEAENFDIVVDSLVRKGV